MPDNTTLGSLGFLHWTPSVTGKAKGDVQSLWIDIARASEGIIVNGQSLTSRLQRLGYQSPFRTDIGPGYNLQAIKAVEGIFATELFSHIVDEQKKIKLSADFIEHLGQEGIGYIASNSLKMQLLQASLPASGGGGTAKVPFERHSVNIRSMLDGTISVLSTSTVVNVAMLADINEYLVDSNNQKPLVIGYALTMVVVEETTLNIGKPTCVVDCRDETIRKELGAVVNPTNDDEVNNDTLEPLGPPEPILGPLETQDECVHTEVLAAEAYKNLNDLTAILETYRAYLIKEYALEDSIVMGTTQTDKEDRKAPLLTQTTSVKLPEKKRQIVTDILDDMLRTKRTDPQKALTDAIKSLETNKPTLELLQNLGEINLWQKIKTLVSRVFNLDSRGKNTLQLAGNLTHSFRGEVHHLRAPASTRAKVNPIEEIPQLGRGK